jgi:molybdopterin-guanine dinucleotide biosynthesis protein A
MNDERPDIAVVILAGGLATRFPGKLARPVDGEPMVSRVYRNALATGLPVYVAGSEQFSPAIVRSLNARMLLDRVPGGGPLRALASACGSIAQTRIFALAGDEPRIDAAFIASLVLAWQPGDEAVVPRHDDRIEPLAALYLRGALDREAQALSEQTNASMRALIERLHARFVTVDASHFTNVNTPEDLRRLVGTAR